MASKKEALNERDYCPPLDPATFLSVVSDYDFSELEALSSARQTLEFLKEAALAEDSSFFDPSGTTNSADIQDNGLSEIYGASSDTCRSRSDETDLTSLSNGMNTFSVSGGNLYDNQELDALPTAEKVRLLQEMFPNSSEFSISHTLKKASGDYNRALEELLNHVFFTDTSGIDENKRVYATSVDAFSEDNAVRSAKKKKDRKRGTAAANIDDTLSSSLPPKAQLSAWEKGRMDVEFISSRVNMSTQTVSSVYHKYGTSLPETIIALAVSARVTLLPDESLIEAHAFELGRDFPSIPLDHLTGIIRLTHPSTANAHELAKVLIVPKSRGGIEVIARYAPLDIATGGDDSISSRPFTPKSSMASADPAHYRAQASNHNDSADRSFAQASAAWRRGKSDRLMGGAAGYYSQEGRDHAMRRAESTSSAADALVDSKSTSSVIDLHGVSVKDAVRIVRQKTDDWWHNANRIAMGLDGRVRDYEGNNKGLKIITGVGRHSQGGVAKIGPAVGKMLMNEGWHVVFEEGCLEVIGKKKR